MIIVNLIGGLGNQLFQYAAGRALSAHLGVPLKFDVSWFKNSTNRKYLLNNFNIKGEIASQKEIEKLNPEGLKKLFFKNHVFIEPSHDYYVDFFNLPDNTYLDGDGHWQSYRYFEKIESIIRKDITLKNPLPESGNELAQKINQSNSVSVHIRRADYLAPKNLKLIGLCTPEYYKDAIKLINQKVKNPQFFVFSDDLEWSKTLPFGVNTTYVDSSLGLKDYEEFMVMSKCKHNILANSTFSWWAGWLNNNPNKIIVAPKNWFISRDTSDLIPTSWKQI